jgi:hypothetical protein
MASRLKPGVYSTGEILQIRFDSSEPSFVES